MTQAVFRSAYTNVNLMLVCPPRSHTLKLMFLYVSVSTLKPMVGIVEIVSPQASRYRMVVFPAASKPRIKIRTSFFEKNDEIYDKKFPINLLTLPLPTEINSKSAVVFTQYKNWRSLLIPWRHSVELQPAVFAPL
jgi:hypothetical protein